MISDIQNLLTNFIVSKLLPNDRGEYSDNLYALCKRYVLLYLGENNSDMKTNGEARFIGTLSLNTVVDIGANVGEFTSYVLKSNPKAEIICIEPDDRAFSKLSKSYSQITTINKAVGLEKKKTIYKHLKHSSWTSFHPSPVEKNNLKKETVEMITLDEACRNLKEIDLLKIDTEGHDFEVLISGSKTIKKCKMIQFEYGDASKFARVFFYDFVNLFKKHNFTLYKILPNKIEKISYNPEMEKCSYGNFVAIRN